jgi:hypothetical protein
MFNPLYYGDTIIADDGARVHKKYAPDKESELFLRDADKSIIDAKQQRSAYQRHGMAITQRA